MQVLDNKPSNGSIQWSSVNITYKGTTYAIANGSTNLSYVYWKYSDPTKFYATSTFPTLGDDDLLVFLNKNGTHLTVPNTTVVDGSLIVPESIVTNALSANCVTGEKILAGTIDATHVKVGSLEGKLFKANTLTSDLIASVSPNLAQPGWDNMDQLAQNQRTSATGSYSLLNKCELSTNAFLVGQYSLWTQNSAANSYKYLGTIAGAPAAAAGERFIASIYACTAQQNVQVRIQLVPYDASGTQLTQVGATYTINQGAWYRISVAQTMPANTACIQVYVRTVTSTPCDVYYDAYQLERCEDVTQTQPSDWAPSGMTVINGGNVMANTITATQISVSTLSAISANIGNVTAGNISGVTIDGSKFTSRDAGNNVTMTLDSGSLTIGSSNVRLGYGGLWLATSSNNDANSVGISQDVRTFDRGGSSIKDLYDLESGSTTAGYGFNLRYKTKQVSNGNISWQPTNDLGISMDFGSYSGGVYQGTLNLNGDVINAKGKLQTTGNVGIGVAPHATYPLYVNGDIYNTGWIRTNGTTGLYFQSYGGGWYMSDTSWIRAYGGKGILTTGSLSADGALTVGASATVGGHIYFDATSVEKNIRFNAGSGGETGFYASTTGTGRLGAWDWAKGFAVWYYDRSNNRMYVDRPLTTNNGANLNGTTGATVVQVNGVESLAAWNNGSQVGWTYGTAAFFKWNNTDGRFEAKNYSDNAWKNVGALGWYTASSKKWKKNIANYTGSALEKVKAIKVRKYKMADAYDDQREKIGLIAEELPADLLDESGQMVDLYPLVTTLMKAVQELSAKVDKLTPPGQKIV